MSACPFEALSSFFEINDARLEALQVRNDELTAELERLRSDLDTVRANVPRQTFGDRWRAAGLGGLGGVAGLRVLGGFPEPTEVPTPPAGDRLPSTSQQSPTGLAPAIEIQPPPTASPPSQSRDPASPTTSPAVSPNQVIRLHPNALLTSHSERPLQLSPSDPITNRAANDMRIASNRSQLFPPTAPINSVADYAFQQLSPDASTDESIAALRSVAVRLAAGIDQMERRQEV